MKNIIAIIWDFDKTLVNGYMQDPIFQDYAVDAHEFWMEVNALPKKYIDEPHIKKMNIFAIYPKGDERAFAQVEKLREDDRIDMFAEADYSEGTTAYMWICNKVKGFVENIKKQEQSKRSGNYSIPTRLV